MNIVYKNDTLFVDLKGDLDDLTINEMKNRLFSILDQYDVDNVIINTKEVFNSNKRVFNTFLNEYRRNYKGKIKLLNK